MAGQVAARAYVVLELKGLKDLRDKMVAGVTAAAKTAGNAADKVVGGAVGQKVGASLANGIGAGAQKRARGALAGFNTAFRGVLGNIAVTSSQEFSTRLISGMATATSGGGIAGLLSKFKVVGQSLVGAVRAGVSAGADQVRQGMATLGPALANIGARLRAFGGSAVSAFGAAGVAAWKFRGKVSDGLKSAGQAVGMAAYQVQYAGVMMTAAFTAPVVLATGLAAAVGIKMASAIEDATVALKALLPAGYDVQALLKRLQALAQASPVFDTAGLTTFTQKMVAAGIEIGKTERFLKAFGNIAVTVGMPMDAMTRALEAFSQMASKGVVNMEELRQQLGDALPGALKIAADGMGVTQKKLFEMVAAGEVTADELMTAFIKMGESATYLKGAEAGANTLRGSWQRLVETIQTKLGDAVLANMDKVKAALERTQPYIDRFLGWFAAKLPGAIDVLGRLLDKLDQLKDKYDALTPGQQSLLKTIVAVAAVAGPVAIVLGGIATIAAAAAGVLGALFSSTGLIVIAVLAVVAAIAWVVTKVKEWWNEQDALREKLSALRAEFEEKVLPAFQKGWDKLKESIGRVKDQLKDLKETIGRNSEGLKALAKGFGVVLAIVAGLIGGLINGLLSALGPAIEMVVSFFSGIVKIVAGVFKLLKSIVDEDMEGVKESLRLIWDGLWDLIVGTTLNALESVKAFIVGFAEAVWGWFKWLYDEIIGHSIIPDLVNGIIDWIKKLPGRVVDFVKEMAEKAAAKFEEWKTKAVAAVSSMVGAVVDWMKELPGRITGAISNATSWLVETGKDIMRGLMNGLSSMAGAVADKAKAVASAAKNAITGFFKIGSPSKVMVDIGRNLASSIALGVQRDIADMRSAIDNSVRSATMALAASGLGGVLTVDGPDVPARSATLVIENYHAAESSDPGAEAERWVWLNDTRGY
jgi:tape measure domain-containing protein